MREILFRGKRTDNDEWVYGYYVEPEKLDESGMEYFIIEKSAVGSTNRVIPETVGQYTGLTDRGGIKIFEGDIVKGIAYSQEWVGVIIWIKEIASFGLYHGHDIAGENSSILKRTTKGINDEFTAKIIGNIHDNPELLKGD